MQMTKQTAAAIVAAHLTFDSKEFTDYDWERAQLGCTLRTAIKHNAVKKITRTRRIYYTVRELVEMLNSCSGTDCYCSYWNLQMDENDRVYEDVEEVFYQMVKVG